jgi:hypothetical protein
MRSSLKELEARLERLIEGSIIRLFSKQMPAASLANQLAHAMEAELHVSEHGLVRAPDNYRISMNPETIKKLEVSASDLANKLSVGMYNAAHEQSYLLAKNPTILIAPNPDITPWMIEVTAWHSTSPLEQTHEMNTPHENGRAVYPRGAFLIIDGDEHFLLDRPVINIGRRKDNQLVLDKPEISRTHAQIRVRQGRFVLFDLGSKSGTQVNDIAIRQHIMQPGDVITICGIHLVYGEETAPKSDQTLGFSPGPLTSSGH